MKNRFLWFVAIIATFLTVSAASGALPTCEQIVKYKMNIMSHGKDLHEIGKNIRGDDAEIVINLIDLTFLNYERLYHLEDLIFIHSIITNVTDRNQIEAIIKLNIPGLIKSIDLSIKQINQSMSHLRSPAVVSTATELKSDLRKIRDLLEKTR